MRGRSVNASGRNSALDEIRKLLADRNRLYGRAELVLDTSGKPPKASLAELKELLK